MTRGNLAKGMLRVSLPLVASNVLQVLFNMSDIAVVGQFAGASALGSVGSTTILVGLFTGFLMGLGSGVNARAALHLGAGRQREVRETVHTAALLCLLMGMALLVLGLAFCMPLLRLLRTKEELIAGAAVYFRIYMLGMPAAAIYNFGNAIYSAAGDTRKPLAFLTLAGALNVGLNLFFVIVLHMDVAGVALASTLSQYLCALLILVSLSRRKDCCGLSRKYLHLNRDKARSILSLGIPSGFQHAIFAIANLFIQSAVNSFDAVMVEGNSAAANADALVYDVMAAFYTGCASFIGQNLGAGRKKRILRSYWWGIGLSFGVAAVMGVVLMLLGRPFLLIFTKEPAVLDAGLQRLNIMSLSYAVSAFMDCTISACRGLGKSLVPTVLVILGSCVFRVIWVYTVFAWFRTIQSLYLLYVFSWVITGAAEMLYFRKIYRETTRNLPDL